MKRGDTEDWCCSLEDWKDWDGLLGDKEDWCGPLEN